ncbi:MAG: bifunctional aspartate kinase/homoserine dehydrogenase I, partial [Ekhidna sp.]|nr:bifunctional aspartate kinase/homoserine dehydrogenase I [Ekhidna sp.]
MKVLKFGGTSLKDMDVLEQVGSIVRSASEKVCVIVSATGGTTNELLHAANLAKVGDSKYLSQIQKIEERHYELYKSLILADVPDDLLSYFKQLKRVCEGVYLLKELTDKSLDFILGTGELVSSIIVSDYLGKGLTCQRVDSRKFITTDNTFGFASVDFEKSAAKFEKHKNQLKDVNVFPGFVAATETGETTTLGRGGSDYSAAIIAKLLNAESLEIWTDVDGIMTADPRRVKR